MHSLSKYETSLQVIAAAAAEKEEENDHFLRFIRRHDGGAMDALVHEINSQVSPAIDCTACGNCCNHLVVNITKDEIRGLAQYLDKTVDQVREEYIEESLAGNCYMSTVPCHFLHEKKCSIYTARFTECRDFPHLHKPGFKERLLGTLLHYGSCPIIYNVIEQVKHKTGFYTEQSPSAVEEHNKAE